MSASRASRSYSSSQIWARHIRTSPGREVRALFGSENYDSNMRRPRGTACRGQKLRLCARPADLSADDGDEPAPLWMPGKRVWAIRFACLVGGNALTACGAIPLQDLSTRT